MANPGFLQVLKTGIPCPFFYCYACPAKIEKLEDIESCTDCTRCGRRMESCRADAIRISASLRR